jgi:hypothetical protein
VAGADGTPRAASPTTGENFWRDRFGLEQANQSFGVINPINRKRVEIFGATGLVWNVRINHSASSIPSIAK